MRIVSFNANGIRSAATKGFFDWFRAQDADLLCLQETKAQEHQLGDAVFRPAGYRCFYRDASTRRDTAASRSTPDANPTKYAARSPGCPLMTKGDISRRASEI